MWFLLLYSELILPQTNEEALLQIKIASNKLWAFGKWLHNFSKVKYTLFNYDVMSFNCGIFVCTFAVLSLKNIYLKNVDMIIS